MQLSCNGCDKKFIHKNSLSRHIRLHPGEHRFPCTHCCLIFSKQSALNTHTAKKHPASARIHPSRGIQSHACSHCGMLFNNEQDVQTHSTGVHGKASLNLVRDVNYCCVYCGKPFISEEGLQYHENNAHKEDRLISDISCEEPQISPVKCKICSNEFSSKLELKNHLQSHYVNKNVKLSSGKNKCLICPRTFASSDGLKYHLAKHTGERPFACSQCNKKFIKKTHLTEHVATHSKEKFFSCDRCPRRFTTFTAFKKHTKTFPGPHNFFCSKCGKVFMKESMIEKHFCVDIYSVAFAPEVVAYLSEDVVEQILCLAEEEEDRKSGTQGLLCYKCLKMFPSSEALQEHQSEHTGKQMYSCRFCPDTFNRADDFSSHITQHLGSTPYMCKQCNRKFITPFTLATHLKNYPGEHSFTCEKCKRWFPSAVRLDKHDCILENVDVFDCACKQQFDDWNEYMKHFGSKPFKCCTCSQEFVSLTPLTRHVKKHTGYRPFHCIDCTKMFLTKASFAAHLKLHDPSKLFKCTMCKYCTRQKYRFTSHLLSKHNITENSTMCHVCGEGFTDQDSLDKHAAEHHDIKIDKAETKQKFQPELCTLCGKVLSSKYTLKVHMKAMHDDSPKDEIKFFCQYCGKGSKNKRHLTRHMEQDHPQPRPCFTCGHVSHTIKEFRRHQRSQSHEQKPFSCTQCGKLFKVAVSLKHHATICDKKKAKKDKNCTIENVCNPAIYPIGEVITDDPN